MNRHRINNISLIIFFVAMGCTSHQSAPPEKDLLAVFKSELAILESAHDASYIDYMNRQNAVFKEHQKIANIAITQINAKFARMTESEKLTYQRAWQNEFQSVITLIHELTTKMVARETEILTPKTMATIKEFSIRRKAAEKKLERVTLVPQFFLLPKN